MNWLFYYYRRNRSLFINKISITQQLISGRKYSHCKMANQPKKKTSSGRNTEINQANAREKRTTRIKVLNDEEKSKNLVQRLCISHRASSLLKYMYIYIYALGIYPYLCLCYISLFIFQCHYVLFAVRTFGKQMVYG